MSGRGIPPPVIWHPESRRIARELGEGALTAEEAALRVGVAVQTIRRWVEQGRMVPRPAEGVLRIPSAEVDRCREWVDRLRRQRLARTAPGPRRQRVYPARGLRSDSVAGKMNPATASNVIGVDEATLRRWTAERRILAFPGVVNRRGERLYGDSQVSRAERYVGGLLRIWRKTSGNEDGTDDSGLMEGTR